MSMTGKMFLGGVAVVAAIQAVAAAANTMDEEMTLGSTWRSSMRASEKPATRAASMNSDFFKVSTSARTRRA